MHFEGPQKNGGEHWPYCLGTPINTINRDSLLLEILPEQALQRKDSACVVTDQLISEHLGV